MYDVDQKVLSEMLEKSYVVFAPKGKDDLKRDYPELFEYKELTKLSPPELLFVWWYSCQSSPIVHLPEEKRFPVAIDRSFRPNQRDAKKQAWAPTGQAPSLPGDIKEAIRVMSKFNPGMRVSMAVDNLYLLRQCQKQIRQDGFIDQGEREDYLKNAALARKIMSDILKDIERGNHGVEEVENTTLANLEDISATFHKSLQ